MRTGISGWIRILTVGGMCVALAACASDAQPMRTSATPTSEDVSTQWPTTTSTTSFATTTSTTPVTVEVSAAPPIPHDSTDRTTLLLSLVADRNYRYLFLEQADRGFNSPRWSYVGGIEDGIVDYLAEAADAGGPGPGDYAYGRARRQCEHDFALVINDVVLHRIGLAAGQRLLEPTIEAGHRVVDACRTHAMESSEVGMSLATFEQIEIVAYEALHLDFALCNDGTTLYWDQTDGLWGTVGGTAHTDGPIWAAGSGWVEELARARDMCGV